MGAPTSYIQDPENKSIKLEEHVIIDQDMLEIKRYRNENKFTKILLIKDKSTNKLQEIKFTITSTHQNGTMASIHWNKTTRVTSKVFKSLFHNSLRAYYNSITLGRPI